MNMQSFLQWLGQKSTIAGILAIAGAVTAAFNGTITWTAAEALIVPGLIALAISENASVTSVTVTPATAPGAAPAAPVTVTATTK